MTVPAGRLKLFSIKHEGSSYEHFGVPKVPSLDFAVAVQWRRSEAKKFSIQQLALATCKVLMCSSPYIVTHNQAHEPPVHRRFMRLIVPIVQKEREKTRAMWYSTTSVMLIVN
jgi:hypothetical protein